MESAPKNDNDPILINGIAVDRSVLEARAVRRCSLAECRAHCCSTGVWLLVEDAKDILAHESKITPFLEPEFRNPEKWFDWNLLKEEDHPAGGMLASTALVKDDVDPCGERCIFLRQDRTCALQAAAIAAGEDPWRFKPFYCILHPLTFFRGRLTMAEDDPLYFEGGGCQRSSCAEPVPYFRLFEPEVKYVLGEAGYAELVAKSGALPNE